MGWVMHNDDGVLWSAWDAPRHLEQLREHFPAAHAPPLQGRNHLGRQGWAPPCEEEPPTADHRQVVTLDMFAFSGRTDIPPTEAPSRLVQRLRGAAHAWATTTLSVTAAP